MSRSYASIVRANVLTVVAAGDQIVADGARIAAGGLRLDESILTGETEPAARGQDAVVHSGAFVVEGTDAYRVTAVGEDSFATRLTGPRALVQARALAARARDQSSPVSTTASTTCPR